LANNVAADNASEGMIRIFIISGINNKKSLLAKSK
jgi:hypothetical protein